MSKIDYDEREKIKVGRREYIAVPEIYSSADTADMSPTEVQSLEDRLFGATARNFNAMCYGCAAINAKNTNKAEYQEWTGEDVKETMCDRLSSTGDAGCGTNIWIRNNYRWKKRYEIKLVVARLGI